MDMRNTYIDTAKGILIFFVVFGHFLERLIGWDDTSNKILLSTIYFIHMPAFIFISGMFFKGTDVFKKVIYFLSLLIPFQIAYVALDFFLSQKIKLGWLVQPYWILWYLVGMIAWVVITPLLKKLGYPVAISIALAVLVGFSPINNYLFSVGRIFTFLPFFVIGSLYGKQIVEFAKNKAVYAFLGFFAILGIMIGCKFIDLNQAWLFGSNSFKQLDVTYIDGSLMRLIIFVVSCVGVVTVVSITQLFKDKFVALGQNTLSIYLLHGFVVIVLNCVLSFKDNFIAGFFVSIVLTIITCFVLKMSIFDKSIRQLSLLSTKHFK